MQAEPRTGRLHEDLAPHAVLHVVAEQDQLLGAVAHSTRICSKHCLRQRLRRHFYIRGMTYDVG